ncbi:hypothetical protein [Parendozoicomonas sp. Alg238-R29]|uniref:hypothetical protein n=1 Tax=Parendozoicomonas sp. Alg238-R29 TaxID=2993446 RepID=UPI00248DF10D|nr:hypothetical protein [Parendozoicomonas sp. Alg238-R29]
MEVYLAARDLAGFAVGTHQFIIIMLSGNSHPEAKLLGSRVLPKNIGNSKIGYVIGAQNRGNLVVEFFEKSDYQATLEFFEPKRISTLKSDFDTQISKVRFKKSNNIDGIRQLLNLVNYYSINQSMGRVKYPTGGFGYNSNSWAQSIIKHSGGIGLKNFDGIDIGHDKEIPKTYFTPICPSKPRPRLNK